MSKGVQIWRHVWPAVVAIAIMMLIISGWNKLGSVIWFAEGTVTDRGPGFVKMKVVAYKLKNYPIVKGSELGFVQPEGKPWQPAEFTLIGDTINRPMLWFEEQSFGEWRWESENENEKIEQVMATVIHDSSGKTYNRTKSDICTILRASDEPNTSDEENRVEENCQDLLDRIEGFKVTRIGPMDATSDVGQ